MYPEIINALDNKNLEISACDNILNNLSNIADIVAMDHFIRNRCLDDIDSKANINMSYNLKLHSNLKLTIVNSINGHYYFGKNKIIDIPISEKIQSPNPNMFGIIELTPDMIDKGFRLVGANTVSLNNNLHSILLINTYQNTKLDPEINIATMKILA
jgi:hypothetical protein